MIYRLLQLIIKSFGDGRVRNVAIWASLAINVWRRLFVSKHVVDVSNIKPGEIIVIEQLPISHKEQIKQFKQVDRRAKKAAKQERRRARRS